LRPSTQESSVAERLFDASKPAELETLGGARWRLMPVDQR
jgi:hypothetical protein